MSVLGIFTVKKISYYEGKYYTYGGFGDYLSEIRKYFNKSILVAHVAEVKPGEGYYEIPSENLTIIHLPQVRSEIGVFLTMPIVLYKSWFAIKSMDVIHARMPNYTGIIGAFFAKLKKKPLFCQIIADWYIEAKKTPVTKKYGLGFFLKWDYYFYDLLERIVCKEQMVFAQGKTCHEKHRFQADSTMVFSSAHREEDIVSIRDTFQDKPFTILTVGRLTGVKNQQILIHVLHKLNQHSTDWRLKLIGYGPKINELKALAEKLKVEHLIDFLGMIDHGDLLWNEYDSSDVFVLPSRSEGTPKVVLEAMARCLPVVASNVGGIPSSVEHGQRGMLFPDNDLGSIVDTLKKIASDKELRTRCINKGRSFSQVHTIESETKTMINKVMNKWPHLLHKKTGN